MLRKATAPCDFRCFSWWWQVWNRLSLQSRS